MTKSQENWFEQFQRTMSQLWDSTPRAQLGEGLVSENWVAAELNCELSPPLGQLVAPKALYEVIP